MSGADDPRPEAESPLAVAGDAARQLAEELAAERGAHAYRVRLENFEGPLDLLLHLIQQHELDVMNIPIAFVTEKYVEYIMLMQELNIDIASEYLVMAATLTHIKSKMLLPPDPNQVDDETEEPEEDPRLELVRRLLEYQKYKLVADQLAARSIYGRDVFGRGLAAPESESQAPLAPISLFKLLDSFQAVLKRAHTQIDHEIQLDRLSISDRINQLADLLRVRATLAFEELFEGQRTRAELVVTFLALLEMTRLRMTRLLQSDALAPIFVELAVREDEAMALAEAATLSLGGGGSMPPLAGDAAAEASGEANADESGEAGAESNDSAGGDVGGEAGAESGADVTTEPAGETTLNESAEAAPDLSDGGDEPQPEVPDEEEREDSD